MRMAVASILRAAANSGNMAAAPGRTDLPKPRFRRSALPIFPGFHAACAIS
jgi:hypothetical protein